MSRCGAPGEPECCPRKEPIDFKADLLCPLFQVVGELMVKLTEELDISPDSSNLLLECERKRLISPRERKALVKKLERSTEPAVNLDLLDLLRKTRNQGYLDFKEILKKLSSQKKVFEELLDDLEERERQLKKGDDLADQLPSVPTEQNEVSMS